MSTAPVKSTRRGWYSVRDLFVLIACIALVMAFVLPWLAKSREGARRSLCSGRLKYVGLAVHNYHSAYSRLPSAMGGTTAPGGNAGRLSGIISLTTFMESSPFYQAVSSPSSFNGVSYPANGPAPWDQSYPPWQRQFDFLKCPSDSDKQEVFGRVSYAFCVADLVANLHQPKLADVRGMFAPGQSTSFRDVTDGLSNTIMMAEIANKRHDYLAGQFVVDVPRAKLAVPNDCMQHIDSNNPFHYSSKAKLSDLGRGGNWADGAGGYSLVHTILPPNGPSCAIEGTAAVDGIYSASSRHPGGCHVVMGDGAVVFISNSIDTGNLSVAAPSAALDQFGQPVASPYGVFGSLGTRAGSEGDVGFDW